MSAIAQRASALIDAPALCHGTRLADVLIGATAIEIQATLHTDYVKRFSAAEGLQIESFLP